MGSLAITSRSFSRHPVLRDETLKLFSDVKFNETGGRLVGSELVEFLRGFEVAITALETIDGELLSQLPDLKVIGKFGVGLDMIDLDALGHHNVKLGWQAGVNCRSVAELVISSAISLLRRTNFAANELYQGRWMPVIGRQLTGCTFGIVGCGHIGKDLITLLKPYHCDVLINDLRELKEFCTEHRAKQVSLEELLAACDVVSIHLPLDQTTKNLIDGNMLKKMKPSAILLNFARGGIVDENELCRLLKRGHLNGAALDVFSCEPPKSRSLIELDNVIATPHIGGSSDEAVIAMGLAALKGVLNPKNASFYMEI